MFRRSLRVACLAMAAWALLFAPGAAGADSPGASDPNRADRVAAAVLAPTFEADSVARSVRHCQSTPDQPATAPEVPSGHLASVDVAVPAGTAVVDRTPRCSPAEHHAGASVSLRGPPRR